MFFLSNFLYFFTTPKISGPPGNQIASSVLGTDLEVAGDSGSDYDCNCGDSDVSSVCSDTDVDDEVPFVCEECGQIFKTQLWFCRHMQRGKHKKPAVSMKDFVYKRMQLHAAQSKQVTSMHFQKMKVDRDGDYLPEPPAFQGVAPLPFTVMPACPYGIPQTPVRFCFSPNICMCNIPYGIS